jgi:hypothetical protein
MSKKNATQVRQEKGSHSISLKGTFIAVMLLGIFMLVSWFGAYALFLSR